MKNIDTRGLSCPQPMLMAKKAMEAGTDDRIVVLTDCGASVENISRAAKQLKWEVSVTAGDETKIELSKK